MGLMLHLPDVPLDQRDERLARARARHVAWREQVRRRVGSGSPAIAALLDDLVTDESKRPGSAGCENA